VIKQHLQTTPLFIKRYPLIGATISYLIPSSLKSNKGRGSEEHDPTPNYSAASNKTLLEDIWQDIKHAYYLDYANQKQSFY